MRCVWTCGWPFPCGLLALLLLGSDDTRAALQTAPAGRDSPHVVGEGGVTPHHLALEVNLVQATHESAGRKPEFSNSQPNAGESQLRWRRTAWGWERSEHWHLEPHPGVPGAMFPPALFALLQVMLSLMALIAWPDG